MPCHLLSQILARREARKKEISEGGSFDPLTPEEREEKRRIELDALLDKLALGKGKHVKEKNAELKKEADNWELESEGDREESQSDEDDDTQTQHKSYLHLLKGRKPPKGIPTKREKLQIAVREGRKREKAKKLYYEEEQQMLREKV